MNKLIEKLVLASLFLLGNYALLSLYGCGEPSIESKVATAEARYAELSNPDGNEVKASREELTTSMRELAENYLLFANEKPDSPDTPERLYKAAELFQVNLLDVNKAIEIYDRLIESYPDHKRAANALFTKAYVYHNTMHDLDRAKSTYLQFVDRYPDHELVSHAQFELDNLGLSAKEALERIQQNQDTVEEQIPAKDPG